MLELASPIGIADDGDKGVEHSKGRADTKQKERQEEEDGPDWGSRHLHKGLGVGQESEIERSNVSFGRVRVPSEKSDHSKRSKCSKDFKAGIATANNNGILDGIGELGVVGSVCSEVAETDASRVKHLTDGGLPDLTARKLTAVEFTEIVQDAPSGILQGNASADKGNGNDDWETNCDVDNLDYN